MTQPKRSWASFRIPGTSVAVEAVPDSAVDESTPEQSASGTFIEMGAAFEGTLRLSGDFRIDNEFRGELETDGTVIVGPDGSIEGNIIARQVEIEGAVVGDITARRLCIVRSNARMHGNIVTACVEIERHAYFEGSTKMLHPMGKTATHIVQQPTV